MNDITRTSKNVVAARARVFRERRGNWGTHSEALCAEVERLQLELDRVTGEREPPHCSTCGCGLPTAPALTEMVDVPKALIVQCFHYVNEYFQLDPSNRKSGELWRLLNHEITRPRAAHEPFPSPPPPAQATHPGAVDVSRSEAGTSCENCVRLAREAWTWSKALEETIKRQGAAQPPVPEPHVIKQIEHALQDRPDLINKDLADYIRGCISDYRHALTKGVDAP